MEGHTLIIRCGLSPGLWLPPLELGTLSYHDHQEARTSGRFIYYIPNHLLWEIGNGHLILG